MNVTDRSVQLELQDGADLVGRFLGHLSVRPASCEQQLLLNDFVKQTKPMVYGDGIILNRFISPG